jgi:hypothetical protein
MCPSLNGSWRCATGRVREARKFRCPRRENWRLPVRTLRASGARKRDMRFDDPDRLFLSGLLRGGAKGQGISP